MSTLVDFPVTSAAFDSSAETPRTSAFPPQLEMVERIDHLITTDPSFNSSCALIIVSIRQYRDLVIELGHPGAEALMQGLALQIGACLRPVDVLGRLGTSEIALVLPSLRNQGQPVMAVRRIQRACHHALEANGRSIKARLVFGIAMMPADAQTSVELLICAETALRHAIRTRTDFTLYSNLNNTDYLPVIDLEQNLRLAIENNELSSVYQPIIDLNSGDLIAVEMLARWNCPSIGPVSPDAFIEIAEKTGLITPLTYWGFNKGLRECMEWQAVLPGLSVSINLSPAVICEPHLFEWISQALKVWGAEPSHLSIEITEQSLLIDPEVALEVLNKLHALGIRVAIDDFGTGHASLSYLKQLPVRALKIDKSFVMHMLKNSTDHRIVKSVIDLADNFDLGVIAEGVEDEETLDSLTLMGCRYAQGYFISPPLAAEDLPAWMAASPWTLRRKGRKKTNS